LRGILDLETAVGPNNETKVSDSRRGALERMRGSAEVYGTMARLFHWSSVLFLALAYLLALILATMEMRGTVLYWHRSVGVFVLFLTMLRLGWRTIDRRPVHGASVLARAAAGLHGILYGGLVIVPLFGWFFTNARGRTVSIFGLALPKLINKDEYYSRLAINAHEYLALTLLVLIVFHIAAAGWHTFILADNTGARMKFIRIGKN
jgi:cytochrome b561